MTNVASHQTSNAQGLPDPWPAPTASGPLRAVVSIPGSKSLSNRYLILAAMGKAPVQIQGLLRSRDTELMMEALRSLGVTIETSQDDVTAVLVTPPAGGRFRGNVTVDCGLAGTVMRFVPGVAFFADGPVRFDGDKQAYKRPMGPVLDGLEQLGATIEYQGEPGRLPFVLTPPAHTESAECTEQHADTQSKPNDVAIDSSSSSQFISALLLMGSRLQNGLHLRHTGSKLPSMPHINMTVADVSLAGGEVEAPQPGEWEVKPRPLQLPQEVVVEPDLSNAAPFLGAALIAGGSVQVPYWPANTTQPGGLLPAVLQLMGAQVTWNGQPYALDEHCGDSSAHITGAGTAAAYGTLQVTGDGELHGLGEFDLSAAGEIAPSIAALAALADGPTSLVGIGHLRGHETNRLAALVMEIKRIGADAVELEDGIRVLPVPSKQLHGAVMETYADHRMATFAAMIGLAIPGVQVRNVATTRKTIPDFTGMWSAMLAGTGSAE